MNRLFILPVLLLTLLVATPASSADFLKGLTANESAPSDAKREKVPRTWGADFLKGLTAYESGDYANALRIWTPLAKQGNLSAQGRLGLMYERGQGVPQDYKTAVKWYRVGAEQGDAYFQFLLGLKYAIGEGVLKDYVYAHMWGNIAAANGSNMGAALRDKFEKKMTPADISTAQKLARECIRKKYKGC